MTNEGLTKVIAVYLGLGSNVGDREANLREAIDRIERLGLKVTRESSIYETEPVGFKDQRWFLNQVIETSLVVMLPSGPATALGSKEPTETKQAQALLSRLLKIEDEMGRERVIPNGPRVIDIDLLLFGDAVIAQSMAERSSGSANRCEIVVPHPRMHQRRFVLEPLCEIAPGVLHPVLKASCREILDSLDSDLEVRLYKQGNPGRALLG